MRKPILSLLGICLGASLLLVALVGCTRTAPPTLSEQPDKVTFQQYFSDLGLGRIPSDSKTQNLQRNATVFNKGDDIVLYGTVKQEMQVSVQYFDVSTKQAVGIMALPPLSIGPFDGTSELSLSTGQYEYKVYANEVLVAIFPFRVQ